MFHVARNGTARNVVWNCISKTSVNMIEGVQRRFLRSYNYRFSGISVCMYMPPLFKRRIYRDLLLLYNCLHNRTDSMAVVSKLNFYAPSRTTRLQRLFYVNGSCSDRSPSRRIQIMYNCHCSSLDLLSADIYSFKSALRTILWRALYHATLIYLSIYLTYLFLLQPYYM